MLTSNQSFERWSDILHDEFMAAALRASTPWLQLFGLGLSCGDRSSPVLHVSPV